MKIYYDTNPNKFFMENRYFVPKDTNSLIVCFEKYCKNNFLEKTEHFFNYFSTQRIVILDDEKYLTEVSTKIKNFNRAIGKSNLLILKKSIVEKYDFSHEGTHFYVDGIENRGVLTESIVKNIINAVYNKKKLYIELLNEDLNKSKYKIESKNGFLTINKNSDTVKVLFRESLLGGRSLVFFGSTNDIQSLAYKIDLKGFSIDSRVPSRIYDETLCLLPLPLPCLPGCPVQPSSAPSNRPNNETGNPEG